uniref:Lysosome-associated membrane glycoprotein 3 n=1 Tax=Oryctolagus cuniculus TaxID=9986 RepID=G1SP75_RABIT|nr:lysosome-associated membrane glycoprotein 3 [Oryctolagus cuniculus]
MLRLSAAAAALLVSLAVTLQDGGQMSAKAFPEIRGHLQPTTAATIQARAQPSLQQPTRQMPRNTSPASSTDGLITSPMMATGSASENSTTHTVEIPTTPATTKSTPSTIPTAIYTLITTQATPNNSHTAAPVTEATIGPSLATHSQLPTTIPQGHTTRSSPSTVSHTPGKTTQPSKQTTVVTTRTTAPHRNTTSQKSIQPSQAPGTATTAHNDTRTTSPAYTLSGPTLAPQPSSAKTGIYQVLNGSRLCIKAEMGLELMVQDKESVFSPQRYFNIDPNTTQASGNCGCRKSNLLLSFQRGFVNLTFTRDEKSYYISEVGALLMVSNPEKTYQGKKSAMAFKTLIGHSFKCVSEQSLQLSHLLQLRTTNVQLQAFDFEGDRFGNVDECSSDYTVVLPVIGAVVVGLCLVGMGVYRIRLKCQASGYQRI